MQRQSHHHHRLLLLVRSLAASAALASLVKGSRSTALENPIAAINIDASAFSSGSVGKRYDIGTKDAPVDGKDGRPHEGPFVEMDNLRKEVKISISPSRLDDDTTNGAADAGPSGKMGKNLHTLKDQPAGLTIDMDGNKMPKSNDGVMDDKNRPEPKMGTTGTSGGVSEKDKERKKLEGQTGERVEKKPETPKEAPPLPHSEQEKISGDKDRKKQQDKGKDEKNKASGNTADDVSGLEKPADLPGRPTAKAPPLPESANKDHLEVGNGARPSSKASLKTLDEGNEGLIQPLHSFLLSLTMILFSEVGDKTFLVAALMAMKHDRLVVFSAAFSALITMTVLSAVLGHTVPALIPRRLTSFLAAGLFFVFGARLLREGLAMSPDEGVSAEMHEVELELEEKEKQGRSRGSSISPYVLEMGLAGGPAGSSDARKPRSKSRFPAPPRSPSSSPEGRSHSPPPRSALAGGVAGLSNLLSLLLSPAWVQTFVMTFLGEWGDRSQIATIAMAAGQDYWWVSLGAVLGHACCTGMAVIGGRAIAGRVSLKVVTVGGAVAFLLFGLIYFIEALYA